MYTVRDASFSLCSCLSTKIDAYHQGTVTKTKKNYFDGNKKLNYRLSFQKLKNFARL